MGLFLETGRAGRLSLEAVGKPVMALVTSLDTSLTFSSTGTPSDTRCRLRSSVGLVAGTKLLVSLGGDTLSLLVSPPMLSFLAADDNSPSLGSVAGVVLTLLTGLLTMGTMESGMMWSDNVNCVCSQVILTIVEMNRSPHCLRGCKNRMNRSRHATLAPAGGKEEGGKVLTKNSLC